MKLLAPLCAILLSTGGVSSRRDFLTAYGEILDLLSQDTAQRRPLSALFENPFRIPGPTSAALEPVEEALKTLESLFQGELRADRSLRNALQELIQHRIHHQRDHREAREDHRRQRGALLEPRILTTYNAPPAKTGTISPDGTEILVKQKDHLEVWNLNTRRRVETIPVQAHTFLHPLFSPNGGEILLFLGTSNTSGRLTIYHRNTRQFRDCVSTTFGAPISPVVQGDWVAVAAQYEYSIVVLNWKRDRVVRQFQPGPGPWSRRWGWGWALAWDPVHRSTFAYGFETGGVGITRLTPHGDGFQLFSRHDKLIRALAYSPDGGLLASGATDQTVKLWETKTGTEWKKLGPFSDSVNQILFTPDGSRLIVVTENHLRIFEVPTGKVLLQRRYKNHTRAALTPDGKTLAVFSYAKKQVELWDFESLLD